MYSWMVGGPGASVNVRGDNVTGTVGAPGAGLSYRQTLTDGSEATGSQPPSGKAWSGVIWILLGAMLLYLTLK